MRSCAHPLEVGNTTYWKRGNTLYPYTRFSKLKVRALGAAQHLPHFSRLQPADSKIRVSG